MPYRSSKWLLFPRTQPDAPVLLVCFPYAGGSATTFRNWGHRLDPRIEVAAVQLPGRDNRQQESLTHDVSEIVREIAALLIEASHRSIALLGHSLGAVLAFEVARRLESAGVRIKHLILAGREAAQLPRTQPMLHTLDDEALIEKLKQLNGTPRFVLDSPEILRFFLPRLRADLRLDDRYVYEEDAPLSCPMTVLGGREDPDASAEQLQAWRCLTRGRFACHFFPGDHFFLHSAEGAVLKSLEGALLHAEPT